MRWPALAVVVLLLAAFAVWRVAGSGPPALTRADVDSAVQKAIADSQAQAKAQPPAAATAYEQIRPSLVTVTTDRPGGTTKAGAVGLGAGVVINADGSVLTALHVVAGAGSITVRFADGTTSPATVKSQQPANDVAVLTPQRLPGVVVPATLGGGQAVGDDVFAVGNPLGLTYSLSAGVVSALDRSVKVEDGRSLAHLIQFDAAVNPGNSGGPLLDRAGRVIGVVTGLANPSGQAFFVGIGFAVPIATAGGAAGAPPQ